MKLMRHFFTSSSLDDLEALELQLEQAGIDRQRIHVLSLDDTGVENHKGLHEVESVMKTDVVRSAVAGLAIGAVVALLFVILAVVFNWPETTGLGWVPFVFAAIIILGFVSWEGGLLGVQRHNRHFRQFEEVLKHDQHVFFVDIEPEAESRLKELADAHASIRKLGVAKSAPRWVLVGKQKVMHFLSETMP